MIVDGDGVIHLDSSSDDDSDGGDVVPTIARSYAPPAQAARKSAPAHSLTKRSAPVAARKAATSAGYDSDEHLQYVIREILSSDTSDDASDDNDSDMSFDGAATAFHSRSNKRKRSSSKSRARVIKRPPAKKHKHRHKPKQKAVKRTARASSSEEEDDGDSSETSASSSESDAGVRKPHSRPSSSKSKKASAPLSRPSRPLDVLVVSSDSPSSSSSDENDGIVTTAAVVRRAPQQPAPLRRAAKPARQPSETRPSPPPLPSANARAAASAAPTLPASHRRSDLGYHALTEKLSFSELQAQHRALEQLAAQHRRGSGSSLAATSSSLLSSAAPINRKSPAPPRIESRKSAVKTSRVDEIERRGKAPKPPAPTIAIAPPPRKAPTPILSPTQTALTIPTLMPPSSVSVATDTNTSSSRALAPLRADRSHAPAVHSTAWRRLRLVRAPPNLLHLDAHLLPFSDEFDHPLPDFDPTGTLALKTQILATFEQTPTPDDAAFGSELQDNMTERVQQLIAEAQPLLRACQERRVQSILRGTREQLRSYLREHAHMRAQLLRCAIPHSTFDLSVSERNDAQRLLERSRRLTPRLNALVGRVRYFVATSTSSDDTDDTDVSDASATNESQDASTTATVTATTAETAAVECILDERVVYPETVIELSDDTPALRRSWAYVGVKKNVHVADDPVLRYIPYLGENTRVHIDPNRYTATTMDKSKRVELVGSRSGSVLELKAVVASALDDDVSEYLLRYVVRACGDSRRVFAALQATDHFAQPYSDYCEIKKHDFAARRVVERIAGMQRLLRGHHRDGDSGGSGDATNPGTDMNASATTAEICKYLQMLGSSCWFLQPRSARPSLTHRLKPPIPYFASNYQRSAHAHGLRATTVYSEATEWFRDLFCRRCYTYDCDDHGILQPTPLQRADPIYPVVTRAGLALRDRPVTSTAATATADAGDVINVDADGDAATSQSLAGDAQVITLDVSSSDDDDDDADDDLEIDKSPTASASASDDDAAAAAVRRRSRRSQTRISTLASASLKVQEKMQEKERRRQRRAEAKQLQQFTRANGDSEYLDDTHAATIAAAVQALMTADAPCSATCWKTLLRAGSGTAAAAASGMSDNTAPVLDEPRADASTADETEAAATPAAPVAATGGSAVYASPPTAAASPAFTDTETLLIRKLAATLGDSACLIAAMLHSASCSCAQISQFLALERQTRLASGDANTDASASGDRRRSSSADMSNRRQQRSDRCGGSSHALAAPRDGLKRVRAQRTQDTKVTKRSYQPCNHDGTCDGCECMKRGHHCDRACACPRTCANRFPGCRCSMGNCRTKACACYAAGRECDPDFCFACGASDAAVLGIGIGAGSSGGGNSHGPTERQLNYDMGLCCNANLLRGAQRKVGISFSTTHGWGAFALAPIRKGEFLYEYTGALISDDEAERRGNLYDVMAISFLFDVNCDDVVDATRKGNKSKFANHKALDAANCEAKILLVNGEHRIALYAREAISVGEELFFDYGYTHETAPTWSRVETRRGGQRVQVSTRKSDAAIDEMDLLDDDDDDDDDDGDDDSD